MRFAALLSLSLCGCVPYWQHTSLPLPECTPTRIVKEQSQLLAPDNPQSRGRTWRVEGWCAQSYVLWGTDEEIACRQRHERAHRAGWSHDDRDINREDCGPDSF